MCQISRRSEHEFAFYSNFLQVCEKTKKKKTKKKNETLAAHLGNGLSDFLQIWNVDSSSWRATLQQIWFQSDKLSPRYKSVKMTFSFFLSIYSRCGAPVLGPHDTLPCVLNLDTVAINTINVTDN